MATRALSPENAVSVSEKDVAKLLSIRNPKALDADVANISRLVVEVTNSVLKVPQKRRDTLLEDIKELRSVLKAMAEATEALGGQIETSAGVRHGSASRQAKAERLVGTGLGPRISRAEGQRRLDAFASAIALEDWAGPVAGATDLQKQLHIPRSTLQQWRQTGAVIGLLKGVKKHVFPLAQFVDGRPLKGISEVVKIAGDPRDAWLWLVEPQKGKAGSTLDQLKRGELAAVLEAAEEDFG